MIRLIRELFFPTPYDLNKRRSPRTVTGVDNAAAQPPAPGPLREPEIR